MVKLKTPEQIEIMRKGGKILAAILEELSSAVVPVATIKSIDDLSNSLCEKYKVTPVFLNYTPHGADRPYPASVCVSLNDEIVHGIPNEDDPHNLRVFKEGDVVSLDMGVKFEGMVVDSATTVVAGKADEKAKELVSVTKQALQIGIDAARAGKKTGDIGHAIEQFVRKHGFGIPEELGGHGVGFSVHEDPFVPNFGKPGQGVVLQPGMTIAIEPMLNEGTKKIFLDRDGYTLKTADGKRSAHFEHTIAITDGEPIILTSLKSI
jgi:methionyl aminopeptidase